MRAPASHSPVRLLAALGLAGALLAPAISLPARAADEKLVLAPPKPMSAPSKPPPLGFCSLLAYERSASMLKFSENDCLRLRPIWLVRSSRFSSPPGPCTGPARQWPSARS